MKKIFRILALTATVPAMLLSCQPADEGIKLTAPVLTLNPNTQITLTEATKTETALTASWTEVKAADVAYTFCIAPSNAANWDKAFKKSATSTSIVLTGEELQNALVGLGFTAGANASIKCRVEAKAGDASAVSTDVSTKVVLYTHVVVLNTPVITLSSDDVVLSDATKDDTALTVSWTDASVDEAYVEYTLHVTVATDTDFANAESYSVEDALTVSFTGQQLQETLKAKGAAEGDKVDLICRVYGESTDGTIDPVTSENKPFSVTLYEKEANTNIPQSIHVVGNAVATGWTMTDEYKFECTDAEKGIFVWTGEITNFDTFKFLANESWSVGFAPGATSYWNVAYKNGDLGDNDYFRILIPGIYEFTINSTELTIEPKLVEAKAAYLCLIGDGCDAAWDIANAIEIPLTDAAKGIYSATINMIGDKDFKVLLDHKEWNRGFCRDASCQQLATQWTMAERREDSDPDEQFRVTESGSYLLSIDTQNLTMTATLQ